MKKNFADKSDSLKENPDDLLMREAARIINEQETAKWDKAAEDYADIDCPAGLDEKIDALLEQFDRKEKFHKRLKLFGKAVAVAVLALGIFTVGLYGTSEAFRVQILDLLLHSHAEYDEVELDSNAESSTEESSEGSVGESEDLFVLQMNYVPEGYILVQNNSHNLVYQNAEGMYIRLRYLIDDSGSRINNEDFQSERVYRNGWEIELRYNESDYLAVWQDEAESFSLAVADMDKENFLKIIEGLSWREEE